MPHKTKNTNFVKKIFGSIFSKNQKNVNNQENNKDKENQNLLDSASYFHDGLAVWSKSVDHFLENKKFMESYMIGMNSGHRIRRSLDNPDADIHLEWRVHTLCWAAAHAAKLEGDFVECGVNTGIFSLAVCNYVDFNNLDKDFWLLDTYEGSPLDQMTDEEEKKFGKRQRARKARNPSKSMYFECYDLAKKNFSPWPRAKLVRGMIPDTLPEVTSEKVCYLSVDLNFVAPEKAAMEYFWPKLVPGGIIVLDDFGWVNRRLQLEAHNEWAKRNGVEILLAPTGQGIVIKP